jgi:hypothetical protein
MLTDRSADKKDLRRIQDRITASYSSFDDVLNCPNHHGLLSASESSDTCGSTLLAGSSSASKFLVVHFWQDGIAP